MKERKVSFKNSVKALWIRKTQGEKFKNERAGRKRTKKRGGQGYG